MLSINLGQSVLEKNCAHGLEYLKTKGTVFLNMDLPGWRLTYISYADDSHFQNNKTIPL